MSTKTWPLLLLTVAILIGRAPAQDNPVVTFASPPGEEIWFGKTTIKINLQNLPKGALHTVEIYLDGRFIKEIKQPPYAFQYNFGNVPQNSTLKALLRVNNRVVDSSEIKSFPIDDVQEVDVTQILVPVVVTDRQGNYISNLKKEDFILLEGDQPQVINNFSISGKNRFHLALLIDISSSMKDRIGEVKEAAKQFLQKLLTKKDKAIVVFFNHEVFEDTEFSSNYAELSNSISMAFPFGATALYDAVGYCIKMLKGMPGLNIIIVLSDGEDNSSYMDPYTLIKKAEMSNAIIYSIGKRDSSFVDEYQEILKKLSSSAGGMLFFVEESSEIKKIYELIRRDIRAEYILEFSPTKNGKTKRYRKISVKLKKKKKFIARTIKGYYY
ncbi:MAG TPA: VWA domain-containing protein [Patescibacteria group bacterium]|nr:VWA domain-containing protein [Patescibacteria group bacterium]